LIRKEKKKKNNKSIVSESKKQILSKEKREKTHRTDDNDRSKRSDEIEMRMILMGRTTSPVDSMARTKGRVRIFRLGKRQLKRTGIVKLNSMNHSLNCCGCELL
jgi:hypothetical protein